MPFMEDQDMKCSAHVQINYTYTRAVKDQTNCWKLGIGLIKLAAMRTFGVNEMTSPSGLQKNLVFIRFALYFLYFALEQITKEK